MVAEYSSATSSSALTWQKGYVYIGGRLLATVTPGGGKQYHHPDRLGTRVMTNADGTFAGRQESLPYGAMIDSSATTTRRFTSYDRSTTTKLDYAVNRFYNAAQGRFTQVDPIGMGATSLGDPQSLNLYAYCGNDPVNHVDPDGLFFKKLFRAIGKFFKAVAKVLANRWVQLALGIALAILSAGSSAFIIHNYALRVGQLGIGVAQTTTITAAGWAAIGLSTAQGVGAVSSFTQNKGSAKDDPHAVTWGVIAASENALDAAESALRNPKCRDLIGGPASKSPRSLLQRLRRKHGGINLDKLGSSSKAETVGKGVDAKITFDIYTIGRDPSVGGTVGDGAILKYADGVSQDEVRAVLVLHELAHATGALKYTRAKGHFGSFGGKNLPNPDYQTNTDRGAIEANRRIYETCIKK